MEKVEDDENLGRPVTARSEGHVQKIKETRHGEHKINQLEEISHNELNIKTTVQNLFRKTSLKKIRIIMICLHMSLLLMKHEFSRRPGNKASGDTLEKTLISKNDKSTNEKIKTQGNTDRFSNIMSVIMIK